MKNIIKNFFLAVLLIVAGTACDKRQDLQIYQSATPSALTASATTIAPVAADSNKVALTLTWTYPNHAVANPNSIKYIVEIDSVTKNFSSPLTKIVTGALSTSYTGKDLNNFLVGRGYSFGVPVDMEVRITSSYPNNNEQTTSNKIALKLTPYKIPPKVDLPASGKLFIVGAATQGGWNNPVPTPSQEFSRVDETTFVGIFNLNGGQSYLLLPVNGDWGAKYGGTGSSGNSNNADGDNFKADGSDLKAPAVSGWYKIVVDFQSGRFTVNPYTEQHGLPDNLYIIGGATPGGWNNPVPTPSQMFTRLNSTKFQIASLALNSAEKYLLLPENGSWARKYGVANNQLPDMGMGGTFVPEGQDIPAPSVSGNYKIEIDFANNSYKLTKL